MGDAREGGSPLRRIISIPTVITIVAVMAAVGALPAFAQQPGPITLTATGMLVGPVEDDDPGGATTTAPATGGPSLLLPIIALILGSSVLGAAVLLRNQ